MNFAKILGLLAQKLPCKGFGVDGLGFWLQVVVGCKPQGYYMTLYMRYSM